MINGGRLTEYLKKIFPFSSITSNLEDIPLLINEIHTPRNSKNLNLSPCFDYDGLMRANCNSGYQRPSIQ